MPIDSTNKYLPDTNVIINYLSGQEPDKSWFTTALEEDQLILSTIVIAELYAGVHNSQKPIINKLIKATKSIPIDLPIAMQGGILRSQQIKRRSKSYLTDCLIAATAQIHNLTLVTHNTHDYPFSEIKIITPK